MTSCSHCGESLLADDRFCPGCGRDSGPAVAVATPPHPSPTVSPRTQVGEKPVPCAKCGHGLAEIERFCPKCGTPRPGLEHAPRGRGGWREIQERLSAVTRGRYRVERELGRGGMAAVYLAHEEALDRKVAIKVMRPSLLSDESMVERFLREARTMAAFQHPNIVTVYAVESVDDLHFFAMQYVAGRPLDAIIRDLGPLPVAAMQAIVYQAAAALTYAHRAGVIHRDVKPGNILIDQTGNAVVTDFGIAKVADLSTTATSAHMGTPMYMSPEQCSGAPLTPASDQYALGNVAYEILAGRPPFQRETPIALAMAITGETPRSIREVRDDCPREIDAALLKMLEKTPAARWSNLMEAASALGGDQLADDDPVREYLALIARSEKAAPGRALLTPRTPRTGTGHLTSILRRRARIRKLVPAAVITIGVGGGIVGYYLTRDDPPPAPAPVPAVAPPASGTPGESAGPVRDVATVVRERLESARAAVARRDWRTAEREAIAVVALDDRNAEGRALLDRARRAIADSIARSRPAPPPAVAVQPGPAPGSGPAETAPVPPPAPVAVTPAPAPAPPPPPPPPVSREPEIRGAIDRYVQAINARNLAQLKALYPDMKADQERRWRDLFAAEVEQVRAQSTIRSVAERGDLAEVSYLMTLVFKPRREDPQTVRIGTTAILRFEGGAWRITTLTERGEQ